MLAVSHHDENDIFFHPLGATGEARESVKIVEAVHAHGNEYLVADPSDSLFGVAGNDVGTTVALEREIDSHPETDPVAAFPAILAEETGITRLGDGYAVISGRPSACDLTAIDDGVNPMGTAQTVPGTCRHPTIANPVGSEHVVAAWNCDCHQVWVTGGPLSADLPAPRAIYGDDVNSASNPRLAPTSAGVWYGFEVVGGRLGRALVDLDGAAVESVATEIVVDGGAGDYDLISRGDQAYLFWTEPAATTTLWTMRLCAP